MSDTYGVTFITEMLVSIVVVILLAFPVKLQIYFVRRKCRIPQSRLQNIRIKIAVLSQKGNNKAIFSGIAVSNLNGIVPGAISVEIPPDQVWIMRQLGKSYYLLRYVRKSPPGVIPV
jgi:hypothetical protein